MAEHKLVGGTLKVEDRGGITARCECGWSSTHFSSFAASAAMMDHQEECASDSSSPPPVKEG
jgi:hypothetical protein